MDLREAFQLLTLASARDGRTVDREVASVWADDLKHVALVDAVEAATMHYRESTAWMMPNHVIANVKRIRERHDREDRIQRQLNPPPTQPVDEGGIEIYRAEVRRLKALKEAQNQ
jgi:hypothetical protein